jgi:hypothetical protein
MLKSYKCKYLLSVILTKAGIHKNITATFGITMQNNLTVFKEIITLDDPQRLTLSQPLPLPKGQQVEVLIIAETKNDADELRRDEELLRSIREKSQMTEEQAFELGEEAKHNIWNKIKGKFIEYE